MFNIGRQGEPWWVAKDVCDALDIKDPSKALNRLDDDEKGGAFIPTPGGEQEASIVNEPGLIRLIMRSNKREAKIFQRWVFHDVLPQIRKTGHSNHVGISPISLV